MWIFLTWGARSREILSFWWGRQIIMQHNWLTYNHDNHSQIRAHFVFHKIVRIQGKTTFPSRKKPRKTTPNLPCGFRLATKRKTPKDTYRSRVVVCALLWCLLPFSLILLYAWWPQQRPEFAKHVVILVLEIVKVHSYTVRGVSSLAYYESLLFHYLYINNNCYISWGQCLETLQASNGSSIWD